MSTLSPCPSLFFFPSLSSSSSSLHLSGFCFPSICSMSARVNLSVSRPVYMDACERPMMASIFGQLAVTDQCSACSLCASSVSAVDALSLTTLLTSEKQSESIRYTMNGSNVIDESVQRFTPISLGPLFAVKILTDGHFKFNILLSFLLIFSLVSGCLVHLLLLSSRHRRVNTNVSTILTHTR